MSVMVALGFSFLLSTPGMIPSALLNRQMRFGRLAAIELTSAIIAGSIAIWLAVGGLGVWALVISSLTGAAIGTILLYALGHWRPRLIYRWSEVRTVFGFGANVTGFAIFNYFARNADNFIIGAFLGIGQLGYYALAYGILLRPRDMVTSVLMRVLFPALSRLQDDDAQLKATYLRACGAIAFTTFPMMLGLMVVAYPFLDVVLGENWLPAAPLIIVFAPLGMIQSIWSTVGQLYLVKNRANLQLRFGVFSGVAITASFLIGIPWGVLGVAISYTAMCLILLPLGLYIPFRLVKGLRLRDLAATLFPHVVSSGTMALAVWCFRMGLTSFGVENDTFLHLTLSVVFGVAIYILLIVCIRPQALIDIQRLLPWASRITPRQAAGNEREAVGANAVQNPALLSDLNQ
jgi:PST family polysaccharide transporter